MLELCVVEPFTFVSTYLLLSTFLFCSFVCEFTLSVARSSTVPFPFLSLSLPSPGYANSILSAKLWIPLSRLTYGAYLLHPVLLTTMYLNLDTAVYYTDTTMVRFVHMYRLLTFTKKNRKKHGCKIASFMAKNRYFEVNFKFCDPFLYLAIESGYWES